MSENFLEEVCAGIKNSASPEAFLGKLPDALMRNLPLDPLVLFYLDKDGNRFSAFGRPEHIGELFQLEEGSSLAECFSSRTGPLVLDGGADMYRALFNRDTGGLIDRLAIDLILPLHFHGRHRGMVAARRERRCRYSPTALARLLEQCAAIVIPAVEMERLELENDRNYYRLFKFDRLVLLGQMAAAIAHELKTPLSTVTLELQELTDGELAAGEAAASSARIRRQLLRLNELIESLLSFSRFRAPHPQETDLKDLLETTLAGLPGKRIPQGVRITTCLEETLVSRVDRNRLQQVLLNVLFNAFDAVGPGGKIHIRAYAERKATRRDFHLVIAISDNGPGIPQHLKTRVLEPFFTTKAGGTGLGLYISYGIMTGMKGSLEIQSSKKGTTVYLILPGRTA